MSEFSYLFFDVDNTLLDFYAAESAAIRKLFSNYGLPNDDKTVSVYSKINDGYWKKLERGIMKKSDILVARFSETLKVLGATRNAEEMNNNYFGLLSECYFTVEGASDILSYLKNRGYKLYATTNGLMRTQKNRMKESGLSTFFDEIFVSETVGYEKPDRLYFETVIKKIGITDKEKVLVIGDWMTSDIIGGKNSGLKTCWYDAYGEEQLTDSDYIIHNLSELKEIL